jgi:hypothetical protein
MVVIVWAMVGALVGGFFSVVYLVMFLVTGGLPAQDGAIISPISAAAMCLVTSGV